MGQFGRNFAPNSFRSMPIRCAALLTRQFAPRPIPFRLSVAICAFPSDHLVCRCVHWGQNPVAMGQHLKGCRLAGIIDKAVLIKGKYENGVEKFMRGPIDIWQLNSRAFHKVYFGIINTIGLKLKGQIQSKHPLV